MTCSAVPGAKSSTAFGAAANYTSTGVRMSRLADERCDLLCLDLQRAETLRAARPSEREARAVAAGFRALGDPTRLTIAFALWATDELCVCDLAWIVERAAGLADYRRDGKMALYSLTERGQALLEALSYERAAP